MIAKLQRDWVQIASEYMEGSISVAELCVRHNVSSRTLYRHVREGDWVRRCDETTQLRALADLMLGHAVERSLGELQGSMFSGRKISHLDCQRNARTLTALADLVERREKAALAKAEAKAAARDRARRKPSRGADGLDPAEKLRKKLSLRLRRLIKAHKAEQASLAQRESEEKSPP